ncbi:MAG TPA: YdeI/OmpD-associated family protein [Lapillicoccus sp.]|nr:YdeI/OmpD-associated family protein [Lapillicoccus sp.]
MGSRPGGTAEKPALFFDGPEDFRAWLEEHHETATELWMGLNKKHVADRGLTWAQAVPEALCFGWIDSRAERIDEDAVRQRWTPRKRTSTWSRVNLDLVDQLTREGRMRPMGIAAWEARREDKQAVYAYEQGGRLALPEEYAAQLAANPAAAAFWAETTPSYQKVCISWVQSAKQQATNDKRMAQLVEDSAAGRLIPSQRYGETPKWLERAAAAARAATG